MQSGRRTSTSSAAPAGRIVPLDRARTFITLSVVFYHAVINYTWFGIGGARFPSVGR